MRKLQLKYCIAGIIILCSCKQHEQIILKDERIGPIKKISIQSLENDSTMTKFIKPVNAISISGKDSLYVAGINKLLPYKDKFIYGDFQLSTLLILDSTGYEISKIGDLGSGAGHYLSVEDFNIDYENDQILVFSNESQCLYTYSGDGKFIKKNKLGFFGYNFSILDSAHLIFFLNQNTNNTSGKYNILVTDRSGKIIQRLFPIRKLPHMVVSYSGFIQQNDSSILYSEPFSDSIYEIKNYAYQVKYHLPFGDKTFPTSKDMSLELLQNRTMKYDWITGRVFESKDYIFFRYTSDRKVQPIAMNKRSGKCINLRSFNNKILENLFFHVCGEKDGVFYSIVDFDIVYPLLQNNQGDISEIEKFDTRLYAKINDAFPFKNPVIFSFEFIF